MRRRSRFGTAGAAMALALGATIVAPFARAATPAPSPSPTAAYEVLPPPTADPSTAAEAIAASRGPDPVGDRYLALARDAWHARTDVPYVHYGALIRYEYHAHVFDNWWDAYFRTSDGSLSLMRLVDPEEDRRRLGGVPFSIFGLKVFDTNPHSEPIRLDEPQIPPTSSFGIVSSFETVTHGGAAPAPSVTGGLAQIAFVASSGRAYDVRYVGRSQIGDVSAVHLTFTPLHDPKIDRIREVWLDPATNRTMQMRVQGILAGKPYDAVSWDVHFVELDGRNYVQQIVAEEPLRFGLDTVIPRLEFDFFDYRFPATVAPFTFNSRIF